MPEEVNELEGLSDAEIADLYESSKGRPDEDATSWAARARLEMSMALQLAKSRRDDAAKLESEREEAASKISGSGPTSQGLVGDGTAGDPNVAQPGAADPNAATSEGPAS